MPRFFLLLLIAMVSAPAALAQDYSRYEFYVGYAYEKANNNADAFDRNGTATVNNNRVDFGSHKENYHGFMVEFNQNVTANIGLVASFSGTFGDANYRDSLSGQTISARQQRYTLLAGPRYNWRGDKLTPFAHALFGVTHVRTNFDVLNCTAPRSRTGFAMAFGAGLDIDAGDKIDIRAFQFDYLPTFIDGKRQDNIRASAGIKIK